MQASTEHPLFFFYHLPRTAGTTLNAILAENFSPEEVLTVYSQEEYATCRELECRHLDRLRLIQGHLLPESINPPRLYGRPVQMFTFLREPVARLISEYHFLKTWPSNHMYAYLNENNISFRHYLTGKEHQLCLRGSNFMTHSLARKFRDIDDNDALELAKYNLEHCLCCFGIQERFDESLLLLAGSLGLKKLFYERRNALKKGIAAEVSPEDLALAAELNQADTRLYEFACQLLEKRIAAQGESFAGRLKEFLLLNGKYQKICALVEQKLHIEQKGDIIRPKD